MGCPCRPGGSVTNDRRQESSGSQAIDCPISDFREEASQKGVCFCCPDMLAYPRNAGGRYASEEDLRGRTNVKVRYGQH
jgi:hypothetical protein